MSSSLFTTCAKSQFHSHLPCPIRPVVENFDIGRVGTRESDDIKMFSFFGYLKVLHKVISFVLYFIVGWLLVWAEEIWQSSSECGYGRLTWDGNKLHSTACVKLSGSYSCMHGTHMWNPNFIEDLEVKSLISHLEITVKNS